MTTSDRNFDNLSDRFQRTIYDSPRGQLRLLALQQDFADLAIPLTQAQVFDIGGGQGQFSLQLAKQGAAIHLCDISDAMLTEAKLAFAAEQQPLVAQVCSLQDCAAIFPNTYDIVLNHAVLEWLSQPLAALPLLADRVKPGGWLSLMFYNLHGHRWRQLMNGRIHDPEGANEHLQTAGNSPQQPLDPKEVEQHLTALGFRIERWRGIRCIHDHMHQKIRERIGQDPIIQADLEFGLQEPYRQLGRYVHFLARKSS